MADDLEYLLPDFDLNTLTVPRLRSILVSHDVSYPASAKKSQLIRILEDEVLPQARRLLRERDRVRRTSEGITDMGSRETSVVSDYDGIERGYSQRGTDRESMPPPPTPSTVSTTTGTRRGRSRQSVRASTADTEDSRVAATPRRKTTSRTVGKHPRASDTETGEDYRATPRVSDGVAPRQSTARKLRRSEVIPSTEVETHVTPVKTEPSDESVFTDDNPFQSGSSPATSEQHGRRTVSRDRMRKSTSRLLTDRPAYTDSRTVRKSEVPVKVKRDDRINMPTRSTFEFAVSSPKSAKLDIEPEDDDEEDEQVDEDGVPTGEEFTPEEQLALEHANADKMYPLAARAQRPRKQGTASKLAPWVVILSLFGGFGAWWRKEKIEIGYCGIGKPTWSLADTNVPDWASVLEPQCEPCPPHAFCYPNFEARCEHDFILRPHPLSLGGLVPLPPTCEPDSEKARRVKAVADKAVEELRERRAKWECGELVEGGKGVKTPEIPAPELKREVAKKRRKGMSDAEFDDLWKGAIGEIIARDEVVSTTKTPSAELILTSTSFARLPLACALRRSIRRSLLAYRLPLSILSLFACALIYARSRILARRSDMARVPELVATTLDRLATQAALYIRDQAPEPYIPIGQLRDDVLRFELHGSRREELWKRVRAVVEGNANVRAAVREGRGGDVARVWEWIGGIGGVGAGRLEDAGAGGPSSRRDSSAGKVHFSLTPSQEQRQIGSGGGDATPDGNILNALASSPRETRTWNEGRPIY